MKTNFICPRCNEANMVLVPEDPPYTTEHLQCPLCDSAFNFIIEDKEGDA
jgi:transcription elongation factor Elf1